MSSAVSLRNPTTYPSQILMGNEDVKALPPSSFQAEWPADLKPACWQKVAKVAFIIFSVILFPIGIALLIRNCLQKAAIGQVLSAANYPEGRDALGPDDACREVWDENRKELLKDPNVERKVITTPDGINLDCLYFKHPQLNKSQGTIIYFNGSGGGYELFNFEEAYREKVNYLRFNYRGVGRSEGTPTPDGLKLDGLTALAFILSLGVQSRDIICHGHSLGGFLATFCASRNQSNLNNSMNLLSNRSFSSLKETTKNIITDAVGSCFGCILANAIVFSGWDYEAISYWNLIRGKKFLVYNPNDDIILLKSTLMTGLAEQPGFDIDALSYLEMDVARYELDPHNRDFNEHEQVIISAWIQETLRRT